MLNYLPYTARPSRGSVSFSIHILDLSSLSYIAYVISPDIFVHLA